MGLTPWAGWLLAAVTTATGVVCLARSRTGRERAARRTARAEAVMGFGMALMAAPGLLVRTPPWGSVLLGAVFVALAARSLLFARGEAHRVHHAVEAVGMAYMAVATASAVAGTPAAHPGHLTGTAGAAGPDHGGTVGGMGVPAVDWALAGYFLVHVLWSGLRLAPVAPTGGLPAAAGGCGTVAGSGRPVGVPGQAREIGDACRIALAMGMLVMVLAM